MQVYAVYGMHTMWEKGMSFIIIGYTLLHFKWSQAPTLIPGEAIV
jgi:hypothetical protein